MYASHGPEASGSAHISVAVTGVDGGDAAGGGAAGSGPALAQAVSTVKLRQYQDFSNIRRVIELR